MPCLPVSTFIVLRKNIHFTGQADYSCRNTCPALFNHHKNGPAATTVHHLQLLKTGGCRLATLNIGYI